MCKLEEQWPSVFMVLLSILKTFRFWFQFAYNCHHRFLKLGTKAHITKRAGEIIKNQSKLKQQKQSSTHVNNHRKEFLFFFFHADNLPVVGLEVDHGEGQCGSRARYVHIYSVTLLGKKTPIICLSFIKKRLFFFLDPYLDLVAGGFVSLPAGPSLSSAVAPNHILIQLLRDIQIRHTNQVTAMLQAEV